MRHAYVANVKLISRVIGMLTEMLMVQWTWWRLSMKALASHSHTYLTWHGGSPEPRFGLTILQKVRFMNSKRRDKTYLSNEDRST